MFFLRVHSATKAHHPDDPEPEPAATAFEFAGEDILHQPVRPVLYSCRFYNFSINDAVYCDTFPKLLGVFGTDIAEDFAKRIFEVFSGNKDHINLFEYLKYIDVYHYGDEIERCKVTCKLMDFSNNGKITLNNFTMYINLIMGAVKKVNPRLGTDLFTDEDISLLFHKIAKNKDYFSYAEFEAVYHEKPELLSWVDYFKNDSNDTLLIIHGYLKKVIKILCSFTNELFKTLKRMRSSNQPNAKKSNCGYKFDKAFNEIKERILGFKKEIEECDRKFLDSANYNRFTMRNIFEKIKRENQEDDINEYYEFDEDFDFEELNGHNLAELGSAQARRKNSFLAKEPNIINEINERKEEKNIESFFELIKRKINTAHNDDDSQSNNSSHSEDGNFSFILPNRKTFQISALNIDKDNDDDDDEEEDNEEEINTNSNNNFRVNSQRSNQDQDMPSVNDNGNNRKSFLSDSFSDEEAGDDAIDLLANINQLKTHNITGTEKNAFFPGSSSAKRGQPQKEEQPTSKNNIITNTIAAYGTSQQKVKRETLIIKFFEYISQKIFKTLININNCYAWIEKRHLRTEILNLLKTKQEETKKRMLIKSRLSKQKMANDPKINMTNIPKNKLKASDHSFKVLLNMIMGIQIAVDATPNISNISKIDQYLNSMTYSIQTINFGDRQEIFLLKEFAGIIFNNIRKVCGFDKDKFIASISPQDFITEMIISSSTIIEELCSTGSSGSLFYYTRDGKFILKTISREEYHTIKAILPAYYKHLMVYPNSLLPKYFGCYKLIKKVKKKMTFVYFIIMMNIFATTNEIHLRFDIKGSRIGRQVLKHDSPIRNINELYGKYSYAFKDLDLERFDKVFYFKKSYRNTILNQLQQDSVFLKECGLNDYSLLVGIHKPSLLNTGPTSNNNNLLNKHLDIELADLPNERILLTEEDIELQEKEDVVENPMNVDVLPDGGIVSEDKSEIYYLGIIDILTNYNCLKTMESSTSTGIENSRTRAKNCSTRPAVAGYMAYAELCSGR